MERVTTIGGRDTQREAVNLLASDGFVLLHEFCGAELLELVLNVSRRKAGALRNALGSKKIGIGSVAGYVEILQRSPA